MTRRWILTGFIILLFISTFSLAEEKAALTLSDAVTLALERNQQVLIARNAIDAMKGRIREVRSQALPFISLNSNALRLRDPSFLNASSFDSIPADIRQGLVPRGSNIFDYSVSVTQPLYTSGKVGTALKLAGLETEGVGIDQTKVEQNIRLLTIRAFYDLLLEKQLVEVNKETVHQRERHLELAQNRYRAGVATEVDVLRSQVSLANAQPELIRAENSYRLARSVLNTLLVRAVDFPTEPIGQLEYVAGNHEELQSVIKEAIERRPELRRLRINEKEADEQKKLAKAENGLRVDFSGEYGFQARDPSNLANSDFTRWNFSVKLALPVFDGGKRSGLLEQAIAQRKIAELARSEQEDSVRLEAQSALDELERAEKTIEAARLNVQQAERVLEMMQNNYKYGAATTLDVLDSQTALTTARWTLWQGLHDHMLARAQVNFVMGHDPLEEDHVETKPKN